MASKFLQKRILVVDDNTIAADLTAELLEMHGYAVAVAYGGYEALAKAVELIPNVVLLDLGMPVLDGYGVMSALRNVTTLKDTLFIAYTAFSDLETRARVRAIGFHAHLAKPARLEILIDCIEGRLSESECIPHHDLAQTPNRSSSVFSGLFAGFAKDIRHLVARGD